MQDREVDWLLREKYHGKLTLAAKRDIKRLEAGEHVDYVIGFANFLGCKVDLRARPLIPRPETEFWVENVIRAINSGVAARSTAQPARILDIFCGSGCIGLAVLKHCPTIRVDFADTESRYFSGIRRSAAWNKIAPQRFRCTPSDVFENLGSRTYDYILANPPYIPRTGRRIQKSVLHQEPHVAFFGGYDGLRYIRKLIRDAREHLAPAGALVFEFDPPQKNQIGTLARRFGYEIQFFKDQYGRWRSASLKVQLRARSRSLA